jgi:nucleoside-diphosphate-sugar epimerase
MAQQFARRTGVPFVGLRISNIMEPPDYARFETWQDDARIRKWNLWGYVDARDVAQAVARSLVADVRGAEVAIIAAADTCMRRPSADLMAEVYPSVELRRPVEGRETLLAIDPRARGPQLHAGARLARRRVGRDAGRYAETDASSTIGFTTVISVSIVSSSYGAASSATNVSNPTFR